MAAVGISDDPCSSVNAHLTCEPQGYSCTFTVLNNPADDLCAQIHLHRLRAHLYLHQC